MLGVIQLPESLQGVKEAYLTLETPQKIEQRMQQKFLCSSLLKTIQKHKVIIGSTVPQLA